MANDAFVKPEIPESMRDLMKISIEQAKRAFDTFASTSEKTWKSLETGSPIACHRHCFSAENIWRRPETSLAKIHFPMASRPIVRCSKPSLTTLTSKA